MSVVGYDGGHFINEPVRDHAGKGKRDLVRRVRYDVIERLYRYNPPLITLEQRDAAVKLQVDDQLSKTPVAARVGTMGTSKSDTLFGLPEAILDAATRVREARNYLYSHWPIVEAVVIQNLNLSRTANAFRLDARKVLPKLRAGLDALELFYRGQQP